MEKQKQQITTENWAFSHYFNKPHRIFISYGAEPAPNNDQDIIDLYYATIVDKDDREAYQQTFTDLSEAIAYINENYNHWEFIESM